MLERLRATWRGWREGSRRYRDEAEIERAQLRVQQQEDARHFAPGEGGSPFAGDFDFERRVGGGGSPGP